MGSSQDGAGGDDGASADEVPDHDAGAHGHHVGVCALGRDRAADDAALGVGVVEELGHIIRRGRWDCWNKLNESFTILNSKKKYVK